MTDDKTAATVLQDWAHANGYATHKRARHHSWIGWREEFRDDGAIDGITVLSIGTPWEVGEGVYVTFDSRRWDHSRAHSDLGYGRTTKRTGTMRWRIAEGYVNGFPLRDILWYAVTRWKRNRG